jgi:hypothetical protein
VRLLRFHGLQEALEWLDQWPTTEKPANLHFSPFCIPLLIDSSLAYAICFFFLSLLTVNETRRLMRLWTRPEVSPLPIQMMTGVPAGSEWLF